MFAFHIHEHEHKIFFWLFSGSPFDEESDYAFNGGECFYGDSDKGFKIRDLGCTGSYPSVCEIKKKHRTSPNEISDI